MTSKRPENPKRHSGDPRKSAKNASQATPADTLPKPTAELAKLLAEALARRWIDQVDGSAGK